MFALVDCNNFFVSCERLFRPGLATRPVVVLSSNDGCVVARSNEAKALGVPMGAPAFQHRQLFKQQGVVAISANFEIYGDISKRITALLTTVTPRLEIYSVDESFLDLSSLPIDNYAMWAREVRQSILKNIGVPVSIGVAPSKTLAKLCSDVAKNRPNLRGVLDYNAYEPTEWRRLLASVPVGEVWGVGWRLAPKLKAEGVASALALSQLRPQLSQQLMGVHGRRLVAELNGTRCHQLQTAGKLAKSIMRSRTFGEDTSAAYVLESAIASMAARSAYALRREGMLAQTIGFFTTTNRHKPGYRKWSPEITLSTPTNDTGIITKLLVGKLGEVFSSSQSYHRLGVFLYNFVPEDSLQLDILGQVNGQQHDKSRARMQAVDYINSKHGRNKLHYAAEDISKSWEPKHIGRSPSYTSEWSDLPKAKIKP